MGLGDRPAVPFPLDQAWPVSTAAQLACILEAAAPKAGNVHPQASFVDMDFEHFCASAVAVAEVLRNVYENQSVATEKQSVGQLILRTVQATARAVQRNTNLGTLLLFGPLVYSAGKGPLHQAVTRTLDQLTVQDSRDVYQAIRLAAPGGMGRAHRHDVQDSPPEDLRIAMRQVADVDAVARQYVTGFGDVFDRLVPWLDDELRDANSLLDAICRVQIRWLAWEPDGLIVRKNGLELAARVQQMAQRVLERGDGQDGSIIERPEYRQLDGFLRADGHRRNPGTTADLVAATLLVRLLEPVDDAAASDK